MKWTIIDANIFQDLSTLDFVAHCGNVKTLLALFIFSKNFREINPCSILTVQSVEISEFIFQNSWTKMSWKNFSPVHSAVWNLWKFSLTLFWQNFRESNIFTKWLAKEMIWRNVRFQFINFSYTFYKFHVEFIISRKIHSLSVNFHNSRLLARMAIIHPDLLFY